MISEDPEIFLPKKINGGLVHCQTWILVINIGNSVQRIKVNSTSEVRRWNTVKVDQTWHKKKQVLLAQNHDSAIYAFKKTILKVTESFKKVHLTDRLTNKLTDRPADKSDILAQNGIGES